MIVAFPDALDGKSSFRGRNSAGSWRTPRPRGLIGKGSAVKVDCETTAKRDQPRPRSSPESNRTKSFGRSMDRRVRFKAQNSKGDVLVDFPIERPRRPTKSRKRIEAMFRPKQPTHDANSANVSNVVKREPAGTLDNSFDWRDSSIVWGDETMSDTDDDDDIINSERCRTDLDRSERSLNPSSAWQSMSCRSLKEPLVRSRKTDRLVQSMTNLFTGNTGTD